MPGGSCGNLTAALAPKFPRSTKPAPLFCDLSRRTAQHRSFPAPWSVYSHPLQNRVPRVQVLLPLPKTGGNTGFSPVFFLHVLYGYGVHAGSDIEFLYPFAPVRNRPHPFQHPKRTRFCLFRLNPGAFSRFLPFWTCKIFGLAFVHSAA